MSMENAASSHGRAGYTGAWLLALGGVVALTGFFLPWWSNPGYGAPWWIVQPASGAPSTFMGPLFVYVHLAAALSGAASSYTTDSLIRSSALLTLVPLIEIGVVVTGLISRRPSASLQGQRLRTISRVLAGAAAVLGVVVLVLLWLAGPLFSLSYPYVIPRPSYGQFLTLAGCVLVLVGLVMPRRGRKGERAAGVPQG